MNKTRFFILTTTVTALIVLSGCNKANNTNEDVTISTNPTQQIETIETFSGNTSEQNDFHIETEQIENGNIEFIVTKGSSIQNIKNGTPKTGDKIIMNGYEYTFNNLVEQNLFVPDENLNGWSAIVQDKSISNCDSLKSEIFGIPVKSINHCYTGCQNITSISNLPDTIEFADSAFSHCSNLEIVENLPQNLKSATKMFDCCTKLTTFPKLPENILYIDKMFNACQNIEGEIELPNSIITMDGVFDNTERIIILKTQSDEIGNNIQRSILSSYWNVFTNYDNVPENIKESVESSVPEIEPIIDGKE